MQLPHDDGQDSDDLGRRLKGAPTLLWIVVPTLAGALLGVAFFNAAAGAALFGLPTLAVTLLIRRLIARAADDSSLGIVS